MKLGDVLNNERVSAMRMDKNAYVYKPTKNENINIQTEKVVFPEPYENAGGYYNRNEFNRPNHEEHLSNNNQPYNKNQFPSFDIKSLLPMLMSGKFNNLLTPLMSMLGGKGVNGGMDFAKIFELIKPKSKPKKEEKKEEDISSKFDDLIIIED